MGTSKHKMKILWLTVDRSHRIAHHFDDFRETVSKLKEVEVHTITKPLINDKGQNLWKLSRDLVNGDLHTENVLRKLPQDTDFIFCDAFFAYLDEPWKSIKIPSSIFIEDIHQEVPKRQIEEAGKLGIQTIFHRFNFAFHKFHPHARMHFNCFWLPHSIKMSRYDNYFSKSIDVLHTGVHPKTFYPNRHFAVETLRNKPYFKLVERPKDVPGESKKGKFPIDKDYDSLLQKAKICVTGGSVFNAPVQKYVEIPADNSLLLTNWFPDLGLMGFVPGTNMMSYFKENLIETVENLLDNEEEIKRISNNGHNLILMKHTSEMRAKQFVNFICAILGSQKIYNIEPCSFQVNFRGNMSTPINHSKSNTVSGTDWKARISRAEART